MEPCLELNSAPRDRERAQWGRDRPQRDHGAACPSVTTVSLIWHPQKCAVYWPRQETLPAWIQIPPPPFLLCDPQQGV